METLNYFNQIAAVFLNPEVKAWKEKNNLVIGVQCSGIPEEIIHAAGIMPMRVRAPGLTDTNKADAHLHRINCSYTRSVLEYLLSGKLDFLDGFVATNTCDHHLRLVSEIKDKSNFNFFHYFQMFHSLAHGSKEWLIKEMQELIKNIEGTLGIRITEDNLRNTISVYNKTRSLMAKVNELRKNDPPPISGTEYLNIVLAGISIPKEIFNEHLEAALPEFEKRSIYNKKLPRLLVVGGSCDLPGFIDFIESKGAYVVADGMCFGLRHYIGIIDDNISDPIEAIAERYLKRLPCPSIIDGFDYEYILLKEIIEKMNVNGIISSRLKFCDHFSGERKMLADQLRLEKGIPVLEIEREYNTARSGQISTRIQAFLELL